MFKVLVDEDMPRTTAGLLRSLDIDAIDVRDVGLKGATDARIFEYAQKEEMIIMSRDMEFGNILKYPLGSHCGIIVARFPHTFVRRQILDTIREFFVDVEKSKLPNNLTIIEVGRYRTRTQNSLMLNQQQSIKVCTSSGLILKSCLPRSSGRWYRGLLRRSGRSYWG